MTYESLSNISDTTPILLGQQGSLGPSTSRLEQPHKQERHHTLTQNLKAMGLWVLSLIKVFNLYFSIRCGAYNSHLHTTDIDTIPIIKVTEHAFNPKCRYYIGNIWHEKTSFTLVLVNNNSSPRSVFHERTCPPCKLT